ncbi:MAG TPA: beta-ketoacyl-ACP reductase [Myxococcales bacterium]|jgi:acetoacetyl-CoA reductase|nr:beta-ketoacyl-ACP reductase [Myxococcales bacterium]
MRLARDVEKQAGERTQVNGSVHKRLSGKVAVVTGSSRGIGKAIARALAAEGANMAVHYCRGREQADGLAAEFERGGSRVGVFQADVSRPEDCHRLLEQAARQLGPVDILVNNAGVNRDKSIRKMSASEWDEVIHTNLDSVFHCTKAALEPMISRGWGRILNIASIIGQTGAFGQANYAAAKAGVIAFTKSVAQEVAKYGVTVNAICPGFVDTDMIASMPQAAKEAVKGRIPLGRFGDADEVARLVRFLCTEGDWITGAQLNINGGQYM